MEIKIDLNTDDSTQLQYTLRIIEVALQNRVKPRLQVPSTGRDYSEKEKAVLSLMKTLLFRKQREANVLPIEELKAEALKAELCKESELDDIIKIMLKGGECFLQKDGVISIL